MYDNISFFTPKKNHLTLLFPNKSAGKDGGYSECYLFLITISCIIINFSFLLVIFKTAEYSGLFDFSFSLSSSKFLLLKLYLTLSNNKNNFIGQKHKMKVK